MIQVTYVRKDNTLDAELYPIGEMGKAIIGIVSALEAGQRVLVDPKPTVSMDIPLGRFCDVHSPREDHTDGRRRSRLDEVRRILGEP